MPDFKKLVIPMKKNKYLLIILAVGILLLLLPSFGSGKQKETKNVQNAEFSLTEYEDRIEKILEKSEGVGRVHVALAVRSTMESVYAEEARVNTREAEQDYNQDSDRKPSILSDGSGGEVPVVIKQMYPEFLGATVVCDGAENPRVCMAITQAVTSLTGISSERITVIKMKN